MAIPVPLSVPLYIIGHWPACGFVTLRLSFPFSTCPVSCSQREVGSCSKSRITLGCRANEWKNCGDDSWVKRHVECHSIMSALPGTISRCPNLGYCDSPMRLWPLGGWVCDLNWHSLQPEVPKWLLGWGKPIPLSPLHPTSQSPPILSLI